MKILANNTVFDLENLTFAQLRALSPATPGGRVPTAKHLLEAKPAVLLQAMVTDTLLTVYTNGYFTALRAGKGTVYSVDRCKTMEYRFDDGTTATLNEKEYCNGPWEVPLLLAADMRLEAAAEDRTLTQTGWDMDYDGMEGDRMEELSTPDALTAWLEEEEANEREALHEKRMKALKAAMESLTDKQRQVVEMYFFRNMTLCQIGDAFGISHQSVKRILNRANRQLKNFFEKNL